MTVKELKTDLNKFDDSRELHVSESGVTMRQLFGILDGKDNGLLILTGPISINSKNEA